MTWPQFLEFGFSLSLQVTLVIVFCHGLGRFFNAREQCRLWTICFVMILLLTVAALTLPHLRLISWAPNVATPNLVGLITLQMEMGKILWVVWLAGSGVMLLQTVSRMVQTYRFLKTCQSVDPSIFPSNDLDVLTGEHRQGHAPPFQLLTSRSVVSPFCWQFHRPCIVLPEYLLTVDREQLRFVVRHEQEHLKTGHPLQLFLQRCVEIVFWFHPLVWWASRQVIVSREVACDAAAVSSPVDIVKYLRTLLAILEHGTVQRHWALRPLGFLGSQTVIESRTKRLVEMARGTTATPPAQWSCAAAKTALVAAAVLAMAVWLPLNVFGDSSSSWSPWPKWTARMLHVVGIHARDFENHSWNDELQEGFEPIDDDIPSRREVFDRAASVLPD